VWHWMYRGRFPDGGIIMHDASQNSAVKALLSMPPRKIPSRMPALAVTPAAKKLTFASSSRRKCRETVKRSVCHELSSLARSRSAHHLGSVEAKPPPYRGAVG
jgi:hypothetical protein